MKYRLFKTPVYSISPRYDVPRELMRELVKAYGPELRKRYRTEEQATVAAKALSDKSGVPLEVGKIVGTFTL
jgi:hypothetical protein